MGPVSVTIINIIVSFCSEHPPSCYTSALQIHNHIISKKICNHIYIYNTHTQCVHIRLETLVYHVYTRAHKYIYIYIYIIVCARIYVYIYIYITTYTNLPHIIMSTQSQIPVTIIICTLICTYKESPSQIMRMQPMSICLFTSTPTTLPSTVPVPV